MINKLNSLTKVALSSIVKKTLIGGSIGLGGGLLIPADTNQERLRNSFVAGSAGATAGALYGLARKHYPKYVGEETLHNGKTKKFKYKPEDPPSIKDELKAEKIKKLNKEKNKGKRIDSSFEVIK